MKKRPGLFWRRFEKAGYDFVRFSEITFPKLSEGTKEDVLQVLISEGAVVKINDEMYTLADYMEQAKERSRKACKRRDDYDC